MWLSLDLLDMDKDSSSHVAAFKTANLLDMTAQ